MTEDVYLDVLAKSPEQHACSVQGPGVAVCGRWAALAFCEEGHAVARTLLCGREWCPDCGQKDSDAHKRRWTRWLPKGQQVTSMGYFVITFPEYMRHSMRDKKKLAAIGKKVTDALISCGYSRGLRRWHWFGDISTRFHPHLNFLVDGGFLSDYRLEGIKRAIRRAVGANLVIFYEYTSEVAGKVHLLKYVTRPTFREYGWDVKLANAVAGFRTTWSWGKWNDDSQWSLDASEEVVSPKAAMVRHGRCPSCENPIHWSKGIRSTASLAAFDAQSLGLSYYLLSSQVSLTPSQRVTPPKLRPHLLSG